MNKRKANQPPAWLLDGKMNPAYRKWRRAHCPPPMPAITIRADEFTLERFRSLSQTANLTHGDLFARLVKDAKFIGDPWALAGDLERKIIAVRDLCTTDHESKEEFIRRVNLCLTTSP